MMIAGPIHPPFSFPSCGKENGPWTVQKKRPLFCRAPVQWPSARTGVSRIGAGKDCRPSAGSRRAAHLSQLCAACPARRKTGAENRMAPASVPAAALWSREGPFQRADTQVRPYGIHWEHPPVLPRRTRQRVAKRNARKEENIKCDFAPRPLSVPRRGDWPPGPERPCRARGEGIANSKAPSHVQPPYDTRALGFRAQSRV